MAIENLSLALQNLLRVNPDKCSAEVVTVRDPNDDDSDSEDDEYDRLHYGYVKITLQQLTADGQRIHQNQFTDTR